MKYNERHEILNESDLTIAPYFRRILSFLIDGIIISLIYVFLELLSQSLGFPILAIDVENFTHVVFKSTVLGNTAQFIIKWILISIPTLYFTLTTFFLNGQTFGKKIFKIQIISLYHKKIGIWHCLERSLGYVASTLEFGLGFVQAVWNNNRMTLHDKIAETIVVNKTRKKL
jgi:uncharacterized RDD family membrane protein YckC